jgi:hypothetical protein
MPVGRIRGEGSTLGAKEGGTLFVNSCKITNSNILVIDGWALGRGGR